jgi:tetratricopeptide (TPR) repeat protein
MKTSIITVCLGLIISSTTFAQTDKTIAAFNKSIEQEKALKYTGAIETIYNLNDSLSYEVNARLGWLCYKAGFKKKSLAYYNKAISIKPNAIEPRYGYGFPAYQLEDYQDLINQDKKILEIDPNNKTINGNLGSIHYYSKEYTKALPYFEKVVSMYPFDYDNNLMLAWTYLRLGKNTEAEQTFNTVLLYSPKDVSALEGLSMVKKNATSYETTLNAFSKSYDLSSKSDYKGAIAVLKEVYDKSSYALNLRLGWLSYLAGANIESTNYYKIAAELKPNAIEPKLGYTMPTELLGNKNELKTQYDLILTIDPHNTVVHYKIGIIDYGKKDYTAALTHFEKIVNLYPCDTDGLLMLGWTNFQMGKLTEAHSFFNKVLCLSPNNASALQGLAAKLVDPNKKTGF